MESDDLDTDVAAIRSRGVSIADGIQEAPWGRFVTFDDPDGNGIVLQATASPLRPVPDADCSTHREPRPPRRSSTCSAAASARCTTGGVASR